MGQLEIHLLKKTARQQNLDCLTHVEQITKIVITAQKSMLCVSCRADATFRQKIITAHIATAQQIG
jgi:hypothetical protein